MRLRLAPALLVATIGATGVPALSTESSDGVTMAVDAAALLTRADDLLAVSAGRLAVEQSRAALSAARQERDAGLEVAALALLGAALEQRGETAAAEETFAEGEALATGAGEAGWQAELLIRRAAGDWRRADYDRATAAGERALAFAEEAGDRSLQARALIALGQCDVKRGAYDGAVSRYGRALALAQLASDRRQEAQAHEALAFANLDRRRYASALEHSTAALALHERNGDRAGQARALERIAVLFLFQGDFEDSLSAAERSLAAATGLGGDTASEAQARQARAGALRGLGRFDEARAELESALAARRDLGDPREEAWLLARLGRLEADLERPAEALARYRAALELWTRLGEWRPAAWYLIEAARQSERLGQDGAARQLYRSAIELAERIELPYRSAALGGLARLEGRAGERAAALLDGRRAVDAARPTGNLEMIWRAFNDLAEVELGFGLQQEAVDHLRAALAAIEAMRSQAVPSDRAKRAEAAERQQVFARAVGLLFDLGSYAEGLEIAERARARASLDLLASAGAPETARIAAELDRAAAEAVPSPHAIGVPPAAQLIGEARGRGLTAIEYFVGDGRLFTWVIGADGSLHATASVIVAGEIEARVRSVRAGLGALGGARGDLAVAAPPATDPERSLRSLYELLIAPIEPWLPGEPSRTVTIVPHDQLFLLSFAALLDADGHYLVERHALSYTPSLALLGWTGREPGQGRSGAPALVVGNPTMPTLRGGEKPLSQLPGAEAEARSVASVLGQPVDVLVAGAAGEPEVRRLAARAPLVHLATHGLLDDEDPLESLVALAPRDASEGGDGRWTMAEIQGETLAADLVTLSACQTGVGRLSGDGVLGLSRAFLVAGARSVVVSLWRVVDEVTRYQMVRFYGALAGDGGDRAAALREAQLATLAALRAGELRAPSGRPIPESPAYWAPFVLIGEPR